MTRVASVAELLVGPVTDRNVRMLASWKRERYTGLTGAAVTLGNRAVEGMEFVWKNRAMQDWTTDYTLSGNVLTMTPALVATDVVLVWYLFRPL